MPRDGLQYTFSFSYEFLHFAHGAIELGVRMINVPF